MKDIHIHGVTKEAQRLMKPCVLCKGSKYKRKKSFVVKVKEYIQKYFWI